MISNTKFGEFGGIFVPEILMNSIIEIEKAFFQAISSDDFKSELNDLYINYANRPSMLYFAKNISEDIGVPVYLKREDLNHTGSHKINNVLGQVLLAKKMGKKRIIAETGAGQHGVATATVCALLKIPCEIYMGEIDTKKQYLNVVKMKLLGARVHCVSKGSKTLKDAVNEALKDWSLNYEDTYYCIGSVVGPYPYPIMVKEFQKIIGEEIRDQILRISNRLPSHIFACVGGGSNAIGTFATFLKEDKVKLFGAEAGGKGIDTNEHGATISKGTPGVFQGMKSMLLQDEYGQVSEAHSISSGLDYPGVGPEHSYLNLIKRVTYSPISDDEATRALIYLNTTEGILPAIESAHALALFLKYKNDFKRDDLVVITISGRGDKDVETLSKIKGFLDE